MPKEITNVDKFIKISERASACRIKKLGDVTKLKIKTPGSLFTIKLESKAADEVLARITCAKTEL